MAHIRLVEHVRAPVEVVYDLWTDLPRMHEWVEGVTGVTDITGPVDRVGTRYTVHFGRMKSPTEVLIAERPRRFRTRFGSKLLAGESQVTLEPDGAGTRLTQEFWTKGLIPGLMARIFAKGSYKGSFRGELRTFIRHAERAAGSASQR